MLHCALFHFYEKLQYIVKVIEMNFKFQFKNFELNLQWKKHIEYTIEIKKQVITGALTYSRNVQNVFQYHVCLGQDPISPLGGGELDILINKGRLDNHFVLGSNPYVWEINIQLEFISILPERLINCMLQHQKIHFLINYLFTSTLK